MCRFIRPPLYPPIKNVPALVSYDMMERKQHTNKPKAMDDDDNTTLSADDFAFFVNTTNDPSLSVPKQVFISLYNKATPENNEMEQQANDATQPQDNENTTEQQSNAAEVEDNHSDEENVHLSTKSTIPFSKR